MMGIDDEHAHLRVWEHLPWIVNGRPLEKDADQVAWHLRYCYRCRVDLLIERALYRRMRSGNPAVPAIESGLADLQRRIDDAGRGE